MHALQDDKRLRNAYGRDPEGCYCYYKVRGKKQSLKVCTIVMAIAVLLVCVKFSGILMYHVLSNQFL